MNTGQPCSRSVVITATLLLLATVAGCGRDATAPCCTTGQPTLRVVNAFTTPVDVLIDGTVVITALPAGTVATSSPASGGHTLVLRPGGSGASVSRMITTTTGAVGTIAAVRALNGALSSTVLDDTNSVVPANATKVRVLHLAPGAGILQVYRTQPDWSQPIAWQFPFSYQSEPTALSAPFYQSTVGTWEIRAWQVPADSSGWAGATTKVVLTLSGGERRTVLILDKPGGGIRIEVM